MGDRGGWVVVQAGDGRVDLTGGPVGDAAADRDPAWSPDGTRLAFASDRSGTWEIYTEDATGGEAVQVTRTEPSRASCSPSWGATSMAVPQAMPSPRAAEVHTLARGWLADGTYRAAAFDPPFTLTLPADWQAWQADADDIWLRRFTGSTTAEIDVGRITVVYPDGCITSPTQLAPGTARDLVSWLGSHPGVTVGTPVPITIGGAPGISVDVTGGGPLECDGPPRIFLFDTANGNFFVRPGETLRLLAVDVSGSLVVVAPQAFIERGTLDAALYEELVAPVLRSVRFER